MDSPYINTKRFYIDEIYFYKDSIYYGSAYSNYSNYYNQPFGKGVYDTLLARIILNENPDLIIKIGQSNSYYLFLKNIVYLYTRCFIILRKSI
jgi:hypothetical protein